MAFVSGNPRLHTADQRNAIAMSTNNKFHSLTQDIIALESETFEISDYSDVSEVVLSGSTSCSSTSTCSSTTSTTSCSA